MSVSRIPLINEWIIISRSTLLRQTVRNQLATDERVGESVYFIDRGFSFNHASNGEASSPIKRSFGFSATIVIEHPDIFVRETDYSLADFDCMIN